MCHNAPWLSVLDRQMRLQFAAKESKPNMPLCNTISILPTFSLQICGVLFYTTNSPQYGEIKLHNKTQQTVKAEL